MSGVVAAGHPESAEAGAATLRAGGNAVDAAVAAVLASFAVESPLTGFGAGGFMAVHHRGAKPALLDFGLSVVTRLCETLLRSGVPGLHFYTINQADPTLRLWENLALTTTA